MVESFLNLGQERTWKQAGPGSHLQVCLFGDKNGALTAPRFCDNRIASGSLKLEINQGLLQADDQYYPGNANSIAVVRDRPRCLNLIL